MKTAEDLNIVDVNDENTRSDLPLIERPVGGITYEHALAERIYGDIYIGAAERNFYVDHYHELCLCAYYNRRIPGTFQFVPEYQFFVTQKRLCLNIFWNLLKIA